MNIDLEKLKAGGIISQRQKDLFSMRVRLLGGNVTSKELRKIAFIADKYGKGYVHLTTRQGFEISFVKFSDIDKVTKELSEVGLLLGACGPRVRVIVSCQGKKICSHALGDTLGLTASLDERFYGRYGVPHKFKMGVTGCPNACAKPQEHDLGFLAVVEPKIENPDNCINCGLCTETCPDKAIKLIEDKPTIDIKKCFKDGKCIAVCPQDIIKPSRFGWNVFIGGKWGRKPQLGVLFEEFLSQDEVLNLVERVLNAYIKLAKKRERVGELINRIGLSRFKKEVYR
jgi:dissimilatory sulfite reductase (desulfoviridin) alpha/beta subunit